MIKKYGKIVIDENSILVTGFEIQGQDNYWEVKRLLLQHAQGRIADALLEEAEVTVEREAHDLNTCMWQMVTRRTVTWKSECGKIYPASLPNPRNFSHCPYCGKVIEAIT